MQRCLDCRIDRYAIHQQCAPTELNGINRRLVYQICVKSVVLTGGYISPLWGWKALGGREDH